uniref:Carboxypeptidase n=1 Tax=Strigamia maritima TaxID=126957 RepID=T1IXT3_STRMM
MKLVILFLLFAFCSARFYKFQANEDEIVDLPGLPSKPSFKQYSGYLNATNNRHLHYWFVESAKDPANDPLLLWMNGGPGCSSLEGFLGEHGPFHVVPGTKKLYNNDFSWNTIANVLYLEAPAGVGFSYSDDKDYKTDDDKVSLDNYVAVQNFFKKFPQFKKNDFYVTGESYGGIYVPTLTVRIFNGQDINLKGFAVGNGLSSYPQNDNSLIFFLYHHGLFGKTLWDALTSHCCVGGMPSQSTCNFHNNVDKKCQSAVAQANNIIFSSGVNPYDLYDVCNNSAMYSTRFETEIKHLFKSYKLNQNFKAKPAPQNLREDPPCVNDADLDNYLNQASVRKALHIPAQVQSWTICSGDVSSTYKTLYDNMTAQYNTLKNLRGLVYNGDVDMMCNFLGDQWFVDGLNRKVVDDYTYWKLGSQVGGFVKHYENLDLVTIRGAGHMVPTNKPKEALKMISSFLYQKPY